MGTASPLTPPGLLSTSTQMESEVATKPWPTTLGAEAHADTDGTPAVLLQSVTMLHFNRSDTGKAPNDNFQEFTWLVQGLVFIILKGFLWAMFKNIKWTPSSLSGCGN